ncbi:MAG: DUF4399 domain-containing protein [Gammaproteobacteria bacterium]|nr:DUF4399 domain-containing protein [Gammaproteobacteria bacterium]
MKIKVLALLFTLPLLSTAFAEEVSKAAEGSNVYIISPADGDTVSSPLSVQFGLRGMGIAPAGTNVENTGHHHLIIDAPLPDLTQPVPSSENYRHFGKGQSEVTLELAPGEHTLQLLLGDWLHRPHDNPVLSEVITITVE